MMDPYFRDLLEGLKHSAVEMQAAQVHLVEASQAIQRAGDHLIKTADAALHAKNEHEDLRVTVNRLEQLVLELRDRLNGREHP
jgi:phosphate uptake regulator